jgi:hypothetical protein
VDPSRESYAVEDHRWLNCVDGLSSKTSTLRRQRPKTRVALRPARAAAHDNRVEKGHIGQPLHRRMSAMRISVPIIDTTMEPMHPTLLEKNPNMAKRKRANFWAA